MKRHWKTSPPLSATALCLALSTAGAQTSLSGADRAFIDQATQGGLAEVSTGQSAVKSKNPVSIGMGMGPRIGVQKGPPGGWRRGATTLVDAEP